MSEEKTGGVVFGIQRFSVHDGPGIRTTVFLKGCNMRCSWCHNPESWRTAPVLAFTPSLCTGCRTCESVCPRGVHTFSGGEHGIFRERCAACGLCAEACPSKALEIIGTRTDAESVMTQIRKDMRYYRKSGGGVTLSGGEALLQKAFALDLLARCRSEGIHTVIETNTSLPYAVYRQALPLTDLILADYKLTDDARHREYTGISNKAVRDTIARLHDDGARVLVRCPIIPGVSDDDGHFAAIAELTRRHPRLIGAELLAYHDLGVSKADRIGADYVKYRSPDPGALDTWKDRVRAFGGRVFDGDWKALGEGGVV